MIEADTFVNGRPQLPGASTSSVDAGELFHRMAVSVHEAASLLGISKDLAYDLVRRDELPSIRLGGRVVVPTRPLLKLLGVEVLPIEPGQ